MHVHIHRSTTPRRIRFAPLPEQTQDQIIETPIRTETPISIPSINVPETKPKQKSSFFRFFKRSSTADVHPQRFSTEDILTLGTSRILRRPRTPQPHEFGSPLSRTSSTSTTTITPPARLPKRPSTAPDAKPRSSANSLGSGGGRHTMPPTRNPQTTQPRQTFPTKSGMRMLNGRVYGSKRHPPTNLFANVRDEPEFVEWGYGGMGSVGGSHDSKYSVLAKGAPALLSHGQAQKLAVAAGRGAPVDRNDGVGVARLGGEDDDDDGSGMGWVRRRRLEKERLAREKELQERRVSSEVTLDTDSRRTSTDGSSSAVDSASTDRSTLAASSAPTTPPSTTDNLPLSIQEQDQHILHAVRLSPNHQSYNKRDLALDTTITPKEPADKTSPSDTSSDDEEAPKEYEEDESEDEDSERKTSLSAGVEKISRHKDALHKDGER